MSQAGSANRPPRKYWSRSRRARMIARTKAASIPVSSCAFAAPPGAAPPPPPRTARRGSRRSGRHPRRAAAGCRASSRPTSWSRAGRRLARATARSARLAAARRAGRCRRCGRARGDEVDQRRRRATIDALARRRSPPRPATQSSSAIEPQLRPRQPSSSIRAARRATVAVSERRRIGRYSIIAADHAISATRAPARPPNPYRSAGDAVGNPQVRTGRGVALLRPCSGASMVAIRPAGPTRT